MDESRPRTSLNSLFQTVVMQALPRVKDRDQRRLLLEDAQKAGSSTMESRRVRKTTMSSH